VKYILALDQGTTSSRAIVFNRSGTIVSTAQQEFRQIFPQPGWVEHDAQEIWATQSAVLSQAIQRAGLTAADISAIGITNQRETTVIWERATSRPVYNAIVWQCKRSVEICNRLKGSTVEGEIVKRTGLIMDPYFSGTKLLWLCENDPRIREAVDAGEALFGTVDTWLIWKLTGGRVHATDYTNASRTMLFNIESRRWDKEILRKFKIPEQVLPEVKKSSKN